MLEEILPVMLYLLIPSLVQCSPVPVSYYVRETGTPELGRSFQLNCDVGGPPVLSFDPSYFWVQDGSVLANKTDKTLKFLSLTRQDSGLYQCGSNHSHDGTEMKKLSQPFDLKVQRLDNMTLPGDVFVVDSQPATLHCRVDSVPTARLTWEMDGQTLRSVEANSDSLVLEKPSPHTGSLVTCRATNAKLPWKTLTRKAVLREPVRPHVTMDVRAPSIIERPVGATLTLVCKVTEALPKVPSDGYSWSYLPSSQEQLRPLVGKTSTLTLGPLTWEDSGQYFCQASNDQDFHGKTLTGSANVTVSVVYADSVNPSHFPDENVVALSAKFRFNLPNATSISVIHPSGEGMVNCTSACDCRVWDNFLSRLSLVECDHSNSSLLLTLEKVTGRDEGDYICRETGVQDTEVLFYRQTLVFGGTNAAKSDENCITIIIVILSLVVIAVPTLYLLKRHFASKSQGTGVREREDEEMPLNERQEETLQNGASSSTAKEQPGKAKLRRRRRAKRFKTHPPSSAGF